MDQTARRAASASPWRAERGTLPKLSTFLLQLKEFCLKTSKNSRKGNFLFSEKNLTVPKKLKGGPFGIFQHPFCRETAKFEGGKDQKNQGRETFHFRKKISQCRKN